MISKEYRCNICHKKITEYYPIRAEIKTKENKLYADYKIRYKINFCKKCYKESRELLVERAKNNRGVNDVNKARN